MVGARCKTLTATLLSFVLAAACLLASTPVAYADSDEVQAAIDKMDQAAAKYEEIAAKANEIDQRIAENEQKVQTLQTQIESKRSESNSAVCSMYRYQRSTSSLIDLVFSTEDVSSFFGIIEYLNRYENNIMSVIDEQTARHVELQQTQEQLQSDKAAADQSKAEAQAALEETRDARDVAIEKAAQEAAAAQAAQEAAAAREATLAASTASYSGASMNTDEVDFDSEEQAFVDEWAPRIDAYLEGSPLAGYGYLFASAAWENGVDPRWSPAISTVESSKGAHCFRSYNAWGWGHVDWSSWEESIPKHVNGLARLYGSTLTMGAAYKYNYETPVDWYYKVAAEMEKI